MPRHSSFITHSLACASCWLATAACVAPPAAPPSTSRERALACSRLADAGTSPLAEVRDQLELRALNRVDLRGELEDDEVDAPSGVRILFAAPAGWTTTWLERRITCYRRSRSPDANDPLLVAGTRFEVFPRAGQFVIDVVGYRRDSADAIMKAAHAMLNHPAATPASPSP